MEVGFHLAPDLSKMSDVSSLRWLLLQVSLLAFDWLSDLGGSCFVPCYFRGPFPMWHKVQGKGLHLNVRVGWLCRVSVLRALFCSLHWLQGKHSALHPACKVHAMPHSLLLRVLCESGCVMKREHVIPHDALMRGHGCNTQMVHIKFQRCRQHL